MLSKNSIFLKVLGTFYDQLANSEMVNNIDYAYTSIIMNRYSDVLNKSIGMRDSVKINNIAHAGFIDISTVSISEKTAVLLDIYGKKIAGITVVAIPYLDTFEFFNVAESGEVYEVCDELIQYASENGEGKAVILYYTDHISEMVKSDKLVIPAVLSEEDLSFIGDNIVKLVQNYLMYKP